MKKRPYTLRPATEADYDFLYQLHRATSRPAVEALLGWEEEFEAEYFHDLWNPEDRQVIVVDGRDIGTLVLKEKPDALYLSLIEILPAYQRRGIGTAIIQDVLAAAHGRGRPVRLHVLLTNSDARRLYERLGFRIIATHKYRHLMEAAVPEE